MSANGHLLLVLHEPPGPNDRDREARLVWRSPDGNWRWTSDGTSTNLLKRHILSFISRAEQLENQLQSASCAADYFELLQAITPLHRTSRNLHNTLQSARDMLPDDKDVIVARDSAGDLERAFELLYTDAKNGLDFTAAQKAELQSQRSYEMAMSAHRLNLLAALFFPVTAISSIFGMNFPSGLESLPGQWLFWGILGGGFLSGVLLTRVIAQKPQPVENAALQLSAGAKKTKFVTSKKIKQSRRKIPAV
ncbi:MAG TPA: CorA family divalent cation transporter [Candidatus Melainabacteria bacterium]|nr:CorA family divalent cation transporter [Candidatus Melainabacteria bacterium]